MNSAVFFVGTFAPPITGQSVAFQTVYDNYMGKKLKADKTPSSDKTLAKVARHLQVSARILYIFLFANFQCVYATTFSNLSGSLPDIVLLLLNRIYRKKVYIHIHASEFRPAIERAPKPISKFLKWLFSGIEGGIVLSPGMKAQFEGLIPDSRIHVIPNYYDPIMNLVSPNRPTREDGELSVGFFSNLLYSKGILQVMSAVSALAEDGRKVKLYIAGAFMGDDYKSAREMKELFDELIAGKKYIKYEGILKGKDKVAFYEKIDVLALPSFYKNEAQPLSIIDGFRAGCAVITTRFNYLAELVNESNGKVVEPRSDEAVRDALAYYLDHPEALKEVQQHNQHWATTHFDQPKYLAAIGRLLNG